MDQERKNNASIDYGGTPDAKSARSADDSSLTLLRDNIIEAARILILRRWSFFIPFCIVTCLATSASHWIKRSYESTTVIERRDHPVLMNLRQTPATGEFSRFFRPTLERDVRDLDSMIEVVEQLKLVPDLAYTAEGELTAESLRAARHRAAMIGAHVSARITQKNEHFDQISITYDGDEAHLPRKIVQGVTDAYIRRTRATLADMLNDARDYFQTVADERRDEMLALEEELLTFQAEYIGVDPTNPGDLKLKLTSLDTEKTQLEREITTLDRELTARRRLLEVYRHQATEMKERPSPANRGAEIAVPEITKSPESEAIEDEIRRLQDEIHTLQLERRMTERHPDIVERRNQIARLRERLKAQYLADAEALPANRGMTLNEAAADSAVEETVGFNMEVLSLQMDVQDRTSRLNGARNRLEAVEQDIAKHESLQKNVFRYRKDYQIKADRFAQARKEYTKNASRIQEIESILNADESERGVTFIMQAGPTGGSRPVRPKASTVLVFSILAGLAAGAVTVLLKEIFDQTYHTSKQVTRSLGLAILESIDEIVTTADRAKLFRRRVVFAPATVTILLVAVFLCSASAYLSVEDPEAYKQWVKAPRELIDRWSGIGPSRAEAAEPAEAETESPDQSARRTPRRDEAVAPQLASAPASPTSPTSRDTAAR